MSEKGKMGRKGRKAEGSINIVGWGEKNKQIESEKLKQKYIHAGLQKGGGGGQAWRSGHKQNEIAELLLLEARNTAKV